MEFFVCCKLTFCTKAGAFFLLFFLCVFLLFFQFSIALHFKMWYNIVKKGGKTMAEERKNEAVEEMTNEQIKMFLESIAIIVESSKDTKDAAKKIRDIKNNYNK